MGYLFAVIFGLIVGSFLNVCIYRIPRGKSIVFPERSYCPSCEHTLGVFDNIPVFSYIFLRGKCRYCKAKISPRYIIVELLTSGLFVLMLYRSLAMYQDTRYIVIELLMSCIFVAILIAISFIDLEFTIIPNKIVYPGIVIGLLLSVFASIIRKDYSFIAWRAAGATTGAIVILLIALIGRVVFRKEAMGVGDIKLMAMIGMYLGLFPYIPLVIMIAAFLGSIVGLALIVVRRKKMSSAIPFGPFLSLGALLSLLYGKEIWLWYINLMGLK